MLYFPLSRSLPPGPTGTLLLLSPLQPLSRSSSSSLTLHVPLVLRDGTSGLTSTGTVTVSVCPCLRGGARAGEKERQERQTEGDWEWERETVCVPQQSTSPSPGLSTAALLAILACVATLLGKYTVQQCYSILVSETQIHRVCKLSLQPNTITRDSRLDD